MFATHFTLSNGDKTVILCEDSNIVKRILITQNMIDLESFNTTMAQ